MRPLVCTCRMVRTLSHGTGAATQEPIVWVQRGRKRAGGPHSGHTDQPRKHRERQIHEPNTNIRSTSRVPVVRDVRIGKHKQEYYAYSRAASAGSPPDLLWWRCTGVDRPISAGK